MTADRDPITANLYGVGSRGPDVTTPINIPWPLSRDEALNLAAYLVLVADPGRERFDRLYHRITEGVGE